MFVCLCNAVTDRTVEATIAAGARTPRDIARLCGAGSECGGCWPELRALLEALGEPQPDHAHSAA